jgi:phosphatidylserine synthase
MISLARDPPNVCSLAGLLAALLGLYFAIRGVYPAAVMALLWAVVFDWSDGLIARRMKGRTADQWAFGAQLDSLIDLVSFSVAPALLLLSVGRFSPWFVPGAFVILATSTSSGCSTIRPTWGWRSTTTSSSWRSSSSSSQSSA